MAAAFLLHLSLFAPALLQNMGCDRKAEPHDRPLGIPGGSGDKIAKGTPEGQLGSQAVIRARTVARPKPERGKNTYMARFSRDGLMALLKSRPEDNFADNIALDSVGGTGPLGLPQGEGTGTTAAGSPWGTRVGAKLWLYRLKYSNGDWAANPRALPMLLREVNLVTRIPVSNQQETLTFSDLPHHRGAFMPSMLFMTGTGRIAVSDAERAALRDYLNSGGMLVADSSGGSFEQQFEQFIAGVLPGKRLRPIERDHEVYRGPLMPYKMPRGCPIYREHGSTDARGIFADDGRLMVFFSPGDLGSAWAVVDLGQKRGAVEQAFQMGTNLVTYSLMHVRDRRK